MNTERYPHFLQDRQRIWLQQSATCHNTVAVREYLKSIFNDKLIHGYCDMFWPARSLDSRLAG